MDKAECRSATNFDSALLTTSPTLQKEKDTTSTHYVDESDASLVFADREEVCEGFMVAVHH